MQLSDYLLMANISLVLVLLIIIGVIVRKLISLQARLEILETKLEVLYEAFQDLAGRVHKLDEKIDIIKEIEQLVERIQVKREEDKDKIKQF